MTFFVLRIILGNKAFITAQNGEDSFALAGEFKEAVTLASADSDHVLALLKADGLMDAESISRISLEVSSAGAEAKGTYLSAFDTYLSGINAGKSSVSDYETFETSADKITELLNTAFKDLVVTDSLPLHTRLHFR